MITRPTRLDIIAHVAGHCLQIGTCDGRMKLIGANSSEATLTAPAPTATASIHILPNTGCLLRLDTSGHLELWSIAESKCPSRLSAHNDIITVCHPMPHDPYALLGTASGAVLVAGLTSQAGEPLGPARAASGMTIMPLSLSAEVLGAPEDTPVVTLQSSECVASGLQVLVLHEWHALCVYSFDSKKVRSQRCAAMHLGGALCHTNFKSERSSNGNHAMPLCHS
jgi:hypothetical protein